MAWYTCTLVSFKGSPDFFCRDSGLICKGLQSLGIPCESIMPMPEYPEDLKEDLIRTEFNNLINPEWWKSIDASSVVLYSWGVPKFKKVAKAINESGAKLFINLDSSGTLPTILKFNQFLKIIIGKHVREQGRFLGFPLGFAHALSSWLYTPIFREPSRIEHLRYADVIDCISPGALSFWRLWARKYAPELVERMFLVPNPVADYIKYDLNTEKEDSVIAVGRWDFVECKRPLLLAKVIELVAKRRSKTIFHMYGSPGAILYKWYADLASNIKKRVYLYGRVDHKELSRGYFASRVSLCTSSHEGSHVPSEEALCAGCTIVAPLRLELHCMLWYVSYNSGSLSTEDSVKGLTETLLLELESWDRGERDLRGIFAIAKCG
ncbi:MAG: hypothetical protein QW255_05195 [Candidatus Bilamarchaeaceae archaeon]